MGRPKNQTSTPINSVETSNPLTLSHVVVSYQFDHKVFFGCLLSSYMVMPILHILRSVWISKDSFFAEYLANDISCKLPPFAMGVSVYISTLTMTIIAIDRYVLIMYCSVNRDKFYKNVIFSNISILNDLIDFSDMLSFYIPFEQECKRRLVQYWLE